MKAKVRDKKINKSFHLANVINIITSMNDMTDKEIKDSFNKVLEMKKNKREGNYF